MQLTVREYQPSDRDAWDLFVHKHPHGSPFHLIAWKLALDKAFGFTARYLLVEGSGTLQAILPLYLIQNPLMGKVLLSTPYAVYGGVLAASDESRELLGQHVRRMGQSMSVQYVEMRNKHEDQCLGLSRIDRYVTFTQEIGQDPEVILNTIPRKTRAAVRKSLTFDLASQDTRDWTKFEDLYSRNLRRLGTPCFPMKWFQALLDEFGDKAMVREVTTPAGQVVSAVFTLYFREQVLPYYGASNPEHNNLQPNNFMYYDLMRFGGQNFYNLFDFGRSKREGSGSFDFKAHWGMVERILPYEMLLVKRKELPNFSPNNPKFQFAIKAWRSVPMPIARLIGPYLVRMVP